MWDSPKTLFVTNSAVSKDKDRQSFKLRPGMDKKIVIYVQQTSNKELAIERYVLSLHREDILIPLQPIIHLIMINMCWIMSFLHLSVPFGPWEHVGCFSLRWLMLCWTEANPAWMHSCAFLFIYVFSGSALADVCVDMQFYSRYV